MQAIHLSYLTVSLKLDGTDGTASTDGTVIVATDGTIYIEYT